MAEKSTTPDLAALWQEAAHAADRGDFDSVMGYFALDAVWEVEPLGVNLEGAPAIRRFLEDWFSSYEEYETEQEEGSHLGSGVVFAVTRLDARPVGSPGSVHERWAFTSTWAANTIVRVIGRTDVDEARAAAERLAAGRR